MSVSDDRKIQTADSWDPDDERPAAVPTEEPPPSYNNDDAIQKRRSARCYNVTMIVVYLALLIIASVGLGGFGLKQSQIVSALPSYQYETCILFTRTTSTDVVDGKSVRYVEFHSPGVCGYVLWGLISVTIVMFVWFIYSIVQAVLGRPKIISLLRIADLIMMVLTFLLSLSLSITIHSGLDATCKTGDSDITICGPITLGYLNPKKIEFFDELNTAKSCSWTMTIFLALLSIWYAASVIAFCVTTRRRRRQYKQFENELPEAA